MPTTSEAAPLIEPSEIATSPAGERQLGLWMAIALVVGNIIGAGVFLLPAALAPYGINAVIGWLVTIGGALCLAFVLAQFAKGRSGGPYGYTREAFGPLPAFVVMWSYWISIWTANAAIAIAATSYLSRIVPLINASPASAASTTVGLIWLFTLINMQGPRAAGVTQVLTTILKLVPLIAVFLLALWLFGSGGARHPQLMPVPVNGGAIASAAALALWSVIGFESATLPVGKIEDPERIVPRATIVGTLIAGVFSLLACAGVLLLLPGSQAAVSPAPFADAVRPLLGPSAVTLIAGFAVISALGALNGWVLCSGEVPLTLARNGVFPIWFSVTTRNGAPVRAQMLSSLLASLLVLTNYSRSLTGLFTFMGLISAATTLLLYLACAAAALKLRIASRAMIVQVLAVVSLFYCIWAFWGVGAESLLWSIVLLATGLPVYWLMRRAPAVAASAA
jgi:basic amino acid/polyamine antiporter, APA family